MIFVGCGCCAGCAGCEGCLLAREPVPLLFSASSARNQQTGVWRVVLGLEHNRPGDRGTGLKLFG